MPAVETVPPAPPVSGMPPPPMPSEGGEIYTALGAVMASVGAVGKGGYNQQQKYNFRGIDELYNAVQPALIEHGVTIVPVAMQLLKREERPSRGGGVLIYTTVRVRYQFSSRTDGSRIYAETIGEGMDSGDKSTNKAMSAAQKYALLQVLCIPTTEPKDSENDNPEPAPRDGNQSNGNDRRQQPKQQQRGQQQRPPQRQQQQQQQQRPVSEEVAKHQAPTGGRNLPEKPPAVDPRTLRAMCSGWAERFNDGKFERAKFNAYCARVLNVDADAADFNDITSWTPDLFRQVDDDLRAAG